ncbi:hypothetical protein KSP40_PGU018867 [Platanthera guangdongensis]|uniref:Protein xylosyltransferase n=1 Tax=Platanthera guangdongensis TaxID=2320717 RepID=A0ABR2LFJ7_9ASPA
MHSTIPQLLRSAPRPGVAGGGEAEARRLVGNQSLFTTVGNVYVFSKANMVTYRGSTMVANTLHACAILLKKSKEWDWFINLSSSDYPLVTQDGNRGAKPVIIDPGFYKKTKSDIFWMMPERELPDCVSTLHRSKDTVTPGGWCSGMPMCFDVGDDGRLNQGPDREVARLMDK